MKIGIQVMERLEILHSMKIIHGDVKPDNLLIGGEPSDSNIIHLIDFGTSFFMSNG
jgi:serine/threonine protein kinase